ncbi:MAG: hypothetical protein QXK06_01210 [Candidatus Diapherotrites archaeon]
MKTLLLVLSAADIPGAANIGSAVGEVTKKGAEVAESQIAVLAGNPAILATAIALIIVTVLIIVFLKKIIINSILGLIAWALVFFVFQIEMPLIPSLVASIVFGLAGIGSVLLLKFFGVL